MKNNCDIIDLANIVLLSCIYRCRDFLKGYKEYFPSDNSEHISSVTIEILSFNLSIYAVLISKRYGKEFSEEIVTLAVDMFIEKYASQDFGVEDFSFAFDDGGFFELCLPEDSDIDDFLLAELDALKESILFDFGYYKDRSETLFLKNDTKSIEDVVKSFGENIFGEDNIDIVLGTMLFAEITSSISTSTDILDEYPLASYFGAPISGKDSLTEKCKTQKINEQKSIPGANKKTRPLQIKYTKVQILFMFIVLIGSIVFTWKMLLVSDFVKVLFSLLLIGLFYAFVKYLNFFNCITSARHILIIASIVFLLFPLLDNIVCAMHEKNYVKTYPLDDEITINVTCDVERIDGYGAVGNEWSYKHYLNDKEFKSGDVLTINVNTPFCIKSQIIEHDYIDDIGEATSQTYKYSTGHNYKIPRIVITQNVTVTEDGGRRYQGSFDFKVTYTLERIISPSMNFWNMLLYTNDNFEYLFCSFLIVERVCSFLFVIFVILFGKHRKNILKKQEQMS